MNKIRIAFVAAALCASAAVHAADPATGDPAKTQYDAERARCLAGTTGQDQASCLRSAGAAYQEAKDGRLRNPNTAYRDNALARCAALPSKDRADCEARVDAGTPRADVKGGGDVKETVTTGIPVSPSTK